MPGRVKSNGGMIEANAHQAHRGPQEQPKTAEFTDCLETS